MFLLCKLQEIVAVPFFSFHTDILTTGEAEVVSMMNLTHIRDGHNPELASSFLSSSIHICIATENVFFFLFLKRPD